MRRWSLDQLTVAGVRPAELVEIAARAGYDAISPFIRGSDMGEHRVWPLVAGCAETDAMARALQDTGVFINIADGFALFDEIDMDDLRMAVDLMASMDARGIVTLQFDSDSARGFDRFCQLNEWARDAGMPLLLEFTPLSRVASLSDALAYRELAGAENIGLLVDLFHLNRSGESVDDLASLPAGVLMGAQLCDGPRRQSDAEYLDQAMNERMVPGEGELPVGAFLDALPDDLVTGVEIPLRTRRAGGEGHFDRARHLLSACQAMTVNCVAGNLRE